MRVPAPWIHYPQGSPNSAFVLGQQSVPARFGAIRAVAGFARSNRQGRDQRTSREIRNELLPRPLIWTRPAPSGCGRWLPQCPERIWLKAVRNNQETWRKWAEERYGPTLASEVSTAALDDAKLVMLSNRYASSKSHWHGRLLIWCLQQCVGPSHLSSNYLSASPRSSSVARQDRGFALRMKACFWACVVENTFAP